MRQCQLCGGPLQFMGRLGNLNWYTCRDCGMQFSSDTPGEEGEDNEDESETSD